MNPKLRELEIHPIQHQGQEMLLLRDPLHLNQRLMIVPQQLGPALALMDGTRNLDELRASLMIRAGLRLSNGELRQIVDQLDQALLLHSERFLQACDSALTQYRRAPFRSPTSAGAGSSRRRSRTRRTLDARSSCPSSSRLS